MRITILSIVDYAGSGFKLHEALTRHTDLDVELFSGAANNKLGHPIRKLVNDYNRGMVQERINYSDIIHLKGDWPPSEYKKYLKLDIEHKPIVISVAGSFFRKKSAGGFERYTPDMMGSIHCTAFEPDLLYPEFSSVWMPHPIDSEDRVTIWEQPQVPVLIHMPTDRRKKDSAFIIEVFRHFPQCDCRVIEGKTFAEAVEIRREATIFFDQALVGFYGNSALEAMQYGIPTAAWISDFSRSRGNLKNCPVISEDKSIKKWVHKIESILDSDMTELSHRTKQWCDMVHGYSSIAKKWYKYYKSI